MNQTVETFTSKGCEGFDRHSGKRWIYPNNMTVRGYQKQAVEKALFTNAMIVLPTGFGKTFIAAVVMYNFYRWYPQGKILFVAPTRPLVAQQIQECRKISGIPASDCIELTGTIPRDRRSVHWITKRVFFATPQVIENDLEDETLPADQVRCLVIDEAHRAQGGYAYVGIVRQLQEYNRDGFRILALSATPGSDIQRVQQVMLNLYIGDVMFRTENSIDLMQYKNEKVSKAWTVEIVGKHKELVDKFIRVTGPIFKELYRAGLTYSEGIDKVAKFTLIKALKAAKNNEIDARRRGRLNFLCCAAMSLSHSFELLTLYGIRVFYTSVLRSTDKKGGSVRTVLASNIEFDTMLKDISTMFGEDAEPDATKVPRADLFRGHPKLNVVRDLLMKHFNANAQKTETRAIVFTKYRESVYDIVQALKTLEPVLKPGAFVGQGSANNTGVGMKQKEQIRLIKDFREGKFNVLVATCVAEEGLDIGEVDLIICYDTTSSPISNTQRRGRTGRKRSGDVQTLLTKGFEEKKLKRAGNSKRQVEEQLFRRENYMTHRYQNAPRMVPDDVKPICLEQKIFPVDDEEVEIKPKRKRQKRAVEEVGASNEKKGKGKGKCKANEKSPVADVSLVSDSDSDIDPMKVGFTSAIELHRSQMETSTSEAGGSQGTGKVAKSDSDIEWESDLEWDCV